MIQFKENSQTEGRMEGQKDGRSDKSCFMETFQLLQGIQLKKHHFCGNVETGGCTSINAKVRKKEFSGSFFV